MKLHKGMCVSKSGEARDWMYYLCRGTLRVYAGNCEGNERTVALLGDDSLAGLDCFLPGETSIMTIACMTDCWLMPIKTARWRIWCAMTPPSRRRWRGITAR